MAITLVWDSKFEVGHERIDAEHRIFLSLIRDLSRDDEARASKARIERTLIEIHKYADFHFTSEENIMADVGYTNIDSHRQIHGMLLAQLENRIDEFRNDAVRPSAIVSFAFEWFALHTTQEDKRLAEFVRIRA